MYNINTFSFKHPVVVGHHIDINSFLVSFFYCHNMLIEFFSLLLTVSSKFSGKLSTSKCKKWTFRLMLQSWAWNAVSMGHTIFLYCPSFLFPKKLYTASTNDSNTSLSISFIDLGNNRSDNSFRISGLTNTLFSACTQKT